MNHLRLFSVCVAVGILSSCAPKMSATHYARWAQQDHARKKARAQEEAAEKGAQATEASKTKPSDAMSSGAPATSPRATNAPTTPPPGDDDYNSLTGAKDVTPPVKTATKSRSAPPADDDAIY